MRIINNKTCRMCDGTDFSVVVDLGQHPLVNSLVNLTNLDKKDPVFPLVVKQCNKCKLVQLTDIIDAEEIYKNVDYLYFASDMPGLDDYFGIYADEIKRRFLRRGDLVVEVGSNDGILLNFLKDDFRVLGVDPATNVALRALKRGIPTVPLFFTENIAKKIAKEWGTAKVIIGNNCIAHLNDLKDLMAGIKLLLSPDGVFVIECNYWGGMVKNINYSLIYHDHYSYFSVKVWQQFLQDYGMRVFDAIVTPAQGGSLRMFICNDQRTQTSRLRDLETKERDTRLNTEETCLKYKENVLSVANKLRTILEGLKKQGKTIAGYGAAAKGFTILNCSNIGSETIDYFIDDSPAKQGRYTPVDHIPIISRKEAEKQLTDYFIILAPNYADVIMKKELEYRKRGGKFILPIGKIEIF